MRFLSFSKQRVYLVLVRFKVFPQRLLVIATVMVVTVMVAGEPANVTATARENDSNVVLPNNPSRFCHTKLLGVFLIDYLIS